MSDAILMVSFVNNGHWAIYRFGTPVVCWSYSWLSLPSTIPSGGIQDVPFASSSALARLRAFLKEMGSGDAETLHGFHSGSAITLALLGAELSEIIYQKHVGWKGVIQHYTIFSWLKFSIGHGHLPVQRKRRWMRLRLRWSILTNCVLC